MTTPMNFLAHIFLSCHDEQLLVGNFIADSVPNRSVPTYPAGIREGIFLHRKIDSFTDNHEKVRESARLLYPRHSKYAPVILDVLYDNLLIQNWEKYSSQELDAFVSQTYEILLGHRQIMPEGLKERLPRMIDDNWLMRYGTKEGLEFAFSKMKRIVSKPLMLEGAAESLQLHFYPLNQNFNLFFPDVQAYVAKECPC